MASCVKRGCARVTPVQAHCPVCHKTFGGVTLFDRHRRDGNCLDPARLGMTQKGSVWRTALPADALERLRGRPGGGSDA